MFEPEAAVPFIWPGVLLEGPCCTVGVDELRPVMFGHNIPAFEEGAINEEPGVALLFPTPPLFHGYEYEYAGAAECVIPNDCAGMIAFGPFLGLYAVEVESRSDTGTFRLPSSVIPTMSEMSG